MSNEISFSLTIKTGSQERRDQVLREIIDLQLENKYFFEYLNREGESDISIYAITNGHYNYCEALFYFHAKYPDVSEDFVLHDTINGFLCHRRYNPGTREELMTEEDGIYNSNWMWGRYGSFYPEGLVMKTFRRVYDWNDNLILEESKDVPFPVEQMYDPDIRAQYEQWKKDPEGWERAREMERKNAEERRMAIMSRFDNDDEDGDDLPF